MPMGTPRAISSSPSARSRCWRPLSAPAFCMARSQPPNMTATPPLSVGRAGTVELVVFALLGLKGRGELGSNTVSRCPMSSIPVVPGFAHVHRHDVAGALDGIHQDQVTVKPSASSSGRTISATLMTPRRCASRCSARPIFRGSATVCAPGRHQRQRSSSARTPRAWQRQVRR